MEFETLYKQTFAQVRCPARVAVAAQPAPRRRFGWVICLAAPLLLAAGVLARVEFTNLHNTRGRLCPALYADHPSAGYAGRSGADAGRRGTAASVPTDADA